jgi:hypothetical protein
MCPIQNPNTFIIGNIRGKKKKKKPLLETKAFRNLIIVLIVENLFASSSFFLH